MKKTAFWALPLVATLALTGCSGLLGSKESPAPSPSASSEATAPQASESLAPATASASATATVDDAESEQNTGFDSNDEFDSGAFNGNVTHDKQLSADDLFLVAKAIESDYEEGGVSITQDAELKTAAEQLADLVGGMDVEPAVCHSKATSSTNGMLNKMNMVTVALPADGNSDLTNISIVSYEEASYLDDVLSMGKMALTDCTSYSMKMDGHEVEVETTAGQASTNAANTLTTIAESTVVKSADGTTDGKQTRTIVVSGYDGVNNVSVNITNPTDDEAAVTTAEEYIDLSLLHMAGA